MKATSALSQEERYKYILNGKIRYYTREELTEYMSDLYSKNDISYSNELLM